MRRLILSLFILSVCQFAASQPSFRASYSSKAPAIFDIQIEFDSDSNDEKDTTDVKALVQNWLGGTIETTIVLTTRSESSNIEIIPIEKVRRESVVYSGARYKWEQGRLLLFKSDSGKFVPSNKKIVSLAYTGATREILGYPCQEARTKARDSVQVVAWICEKLPSCINPAVPISGVKGAVLEYVEKGGEEITLRKLEVL